MGCCCWSWSLYWIVCISFYRFFFIDCEENKMLKRCVCLPLHNICVLSKEKKRLKYRSFVVLLVRITKIALIYCFAFAIYTHKYWIEHHFICRVQDLFLNPNEKKRKQSLNMWTKRKKSQKNKTNSYFFLFVSKLKCEQFI